MVEFLQQNWIGVLFVVAMLAMHLGGHPTRDVDARSPGRPDPSRDAFRPDEDPPGEYLRPRHPTHPTR